MNQMTFTNGMKELRAIWPERSAQLTDRAVRRYWSATQHLTDEEFDRAVDLAVQECTYFPKPAELLQLAGVTGRSSGRRTELRAKVARYCTSQGQDVPSEGSFVVPSRGGEERFGCACDIGTRELFRVVETVPVAA